MFWLGKDRNLAFDPLKLPPKFYASGATDDFNNEEATKPAAGYGGWNGSGSTTKIQDVGQKPVESNSLAVFDMSGNVVEWCFHLAGPATRYPFGLATGPTLLNSSKWVKPKESILPASVAGAGFTL